MLVLRILQTSRCASALAAEHVACRFASASATAWLSVFEPDVEVGKNGVRLHFNKIVNVLLDVKF